MARDEHLKLYKFLSGNNINYMLVFTMAGSVPRYWKLFQLLKEEEATHYFSLYSQRVAPILSACKSIATATSKLQVVTMLNNVIPCCVQDVIVQIEYWN